MEDADNDDELSSFLHIAAATANVIEYLRKKKQIDGEAKESRKAKEADDEQASGKLPIIGG